MVRGNVVMTSYWVREIPSSLRYEKRSWRRREKGEREERREKRVGEREREFFRDCWNATCIQVIVYKHILHDFNISSKIQ